MLVYVACVPLDVNVWAGNVTGVDTEVVRNVAIYIGAQLREMYEPIYLCVLHNTMRP